MSDSPVLLESNLPGFPLVSRGKVRDIYFVDDHLLIVATDRISAFDYILASGIPDKGRVLTQLTLFWLDMLKAIVPNHLITADVAEYPVALRAHRDQLAGRSMLVRRADMIGIECVARGYLAGSGWRDYQLTRSVCDIPLPLNLVESDRLPRPIFTPATKSQTGHDENVPLQQVAADIGLALASRLQNLTLVIYQKAADYALTRRIIVADTKFEFGFIDGELILCDEVLTPDSSRFWPAGEYQPGRPQASFDKQYVRDYLESIGWDKKPPAPALPPDVVLRTSEKYREAHRLITGHQLPA